MQTKFLTLTLLALMALGNAYSQDRRDRGNRGNRGDRNVTRATTPTTVDRTANRTPRATRTTRATRGATVGEQRRAQRDRLRANRPSPRDIRTTRRGDRRTTPVITTRRGDRVRSQNNRRVIRREHARRVNRYRPNRGYYGTRSYHSPYGYRYRTYNRYYHTPHYRNYVHTRRYNQSRHYYRYVRNQYRNSLYLNWILFPSSRVNGYYVVDSYPYYIHNGYRHRYSSMDYCNYQLVDKYNHNVVRTYWDRTCNRGYNECALDRDRKNEREWNNRYFCAETFRDRSYNFSTPTYNYEYEDYDEYDYQYSNNYNDYDYNYSDQQYGEPYSTSRGVCYDYDTQTGVCYDNEY